MLEHFRLVSSRTSEFNNSLAISVSHQGVLDREINSPYTELFCALQDVKGTQPLFTTCRIGTVHIISGAQCIIKMHDSMFKIKIQDGNSRELRQALDLLSKGPCVTTWVGPMKLALCGRNLLGYCNSLLSPSPLPHFVKFFLRTF